MGIDLALLSDNTHQGETWDGDEEGNVEEKRVAQLLNNDKINLECKEAFRQQRIIGWEYIFRGKFAKGWKNCWTECWQWATKFAILMMTRGRACWISRNRTLFGEKKNSYAIMRKILLAKAKSVEKSDDDGATSWRCSYQNEEENIENSSFNNNSDMAGWTTRLKKRKYCTGKQQI